MNIVVAIVGHRVEGHYADTLFYQSDRMHIQGAEMATSSLYTDLNIDTPEAARNMELAFQKAERGEINIPEKEVVIVTDPEKMRRFIRG